MINPVLRHELLVSKRWIIQAMENCSPSPGNSSRRMIGCGHGSAAKRSSRRTGAHDYRHARRRPALRRSEHERRKLPCPVEARRFKGFEAVVVILWLPPLIDAEVDRELLYVGLSRGKSRLYRVGTQRAFTAVVTRP
jgi:hypothetical protein